MSIMWADNFSMYGTNSAFMLNGIYAQADGGIVSDPDVRATGNVIRLSDGFGNNSVPWRFVFPAGAQTTAGVAFRVWFNVLPSDNSHHYQWEFNDASNAVIGYLWVTSTGALAFTMSGGATYTTATPVITANGWYHIEMKYTNNGTSLGSIEVRVEGITVISETSVANTATANVAQVEITTYRISNDTIAYNKDLVIWNGSGSVNNNFLGSVLVKTMLPTSDVALNWTPSSGSNGYSLLSQSPPVDTNYISAGASPIPAAYEAGLSDLPATATSVKALISVVRAAKSDGGDGSLQASLVSGSSTANGSNRPITTAETYWFDPQELDPATSSAWTPVSANNAILKINRTT